MEDEKRKRESQTIKIKTTDKVYNVLSCLAKEAGMPMTQYIIHLILEKEDTNQTYTIIETNSANADTTSYTAKNKEAAQSKFEEIRQHYLDKCSSDGDIDHDYIEIDDTDMFMIYDESIDADRVVQIVSSQKV